VPHGVTAALLKALGSSGQSVTEDRRNTRFSGEETASVFDRKDLPSASGQRTCALRCNCLAADKTNYLNCTRFETRQDKPERQMWSISSGYCRRCFHVLRQRQRVV